VLPEVEAPEASGFGCGTGAGCGCFGLVPEVEGLGDELLVAGDVLGPELGRDPGGISGTGGATGGAALAGVGGAIVVDGPRG